MKSYATLMALEPSAYLDPEFFRTTWPLDQDPTSRGHHFQRGLKQSRESTRVYVKAGGTWGAGTKTGGIVTSYEGIGYHAGTADFWRGVLAGPAEVGVYRAGKYTVIKPASQPEPALP